MLDHTVCTCVYNSACFYFVLFFFCACLFYPTMLCVYIFEIMDHYIYNILVNVDGLIIVIVATVPYITETNELEIQEILRLKFR